MNKRTVDLTFDELVKAGAEAASDAIKRAHGQGLATTSVDSNGSLIRTYPDGKVDFVSTESKPPLTKRRSRAA